MVTQIVHIFGSSVEHLKSRRRTNICCCCLLPIVVKRISCWRGFVDLIRSAQVVDKHVSDFVETVRLRVWENWMIFIIIGNLVLSFLEGRLLFRPLKLLHWGTLGEQLPHATTCVPAFCLVKWRKCWVFSSGLSVEEIGQTWH